MIPAWNVLSRRLTGLGNQQTGKAYRSESGCSVWWPIECVSGVGKTTKSGHTLAWWWTGNPSC